MHESMYVLCKYICIHKYSLMFKCVYLRDTVARITSIHSHTHFCLVLFCFDVGSRDQTQVHVLVGHKHFIS